MPAVFPTETRIVQEEAGRKRGSEFNTKHAAILDNWVHVCLDRCLRKPAGLHTQAELAEAGKEELRPLERRSRQAGV